MRVTIIIKVVFLFIITYSCTQSGRRRPKDKLPQLDNSREIRSAKSSKEKVVIPVENINGVSRIPIEVNGVRMYFIFDTGASMVSISETEAKFLFKQGLLEKSDIMGTAEFVDANGDISAGTVINLKSIRIGNQTVYNVQASVVHNMSAPLLLGQTFLEKFGKITIDNKKGEISFE